jgi:hypothetical protein
MVADPVGSVWHVAHMVIEPENTVNPLLDVFGFYGMLFLGLAQISGKDAKQLVGR